MKHETLKIAAIADTHIDQSSIGRFREIFSQAALQADVFALCGDLTDFGQIKEAEILIDELKDIKIPIIAVLGNHDFESDHQEEISHMLSQANIAVLEGTEFLYKKNDITYGFTGIKGFGGGFMPYMWGRFGETEQKAFYDALIKEIQTLENGLNRLQHLQKNHAIVLMHYAPIRATLHGEIPELYAFLGSTRLEEVIDRYENVGAVIHGHAHFGHPFGKTTMKQIPVYNVAFPLMQRLHPKNPFAIIEV